MSVVKSVEQMTILEGDRVILKNLLVNRLIESGWQDKVRILCRDAVADETALITVEEISAKVTNSARQLIPDIVKKELLQNIRQTLLRLDSA